MSTLFSVNADALSFDPLNAAIRNAEGMDSEVIELHRDALWRLDGDNCWRMIICLRGEIWITQEQDVKDYVLTAGDMFIISQPGSVLIEALDDASVEITPSLRKKPYRGAYRIFQ